MNIAIIGFGNVGSALGYNWFKAGHGVIFGVRETAPKSKENGSDDDWYVITDIASAIARADVVLIATPPDAIDSMIPFFREASDKVIIDATNAFRTKPDGFATVYHALLALTDCRKLVKCFNSTGFENMADPSYYLSDSIEHGVKLDMFMAGDNESAKEICDVLAKDSGFEHCYDFGGGDKVELLEQFALSWINLAMMQKMGRNIGFKLIRRKS